MQLTNESNIHVCAAGCFERSPAQQVASRNPPSPYRSEQVAGEVASLAASLILWPGLQEVLRALVHEGLDSAASLEGITLEVLKVGALGMHCVAFSQLIVSCSH